MKNPYLIPLLALGALPLYAAVDQPAPAPRTMSTEEGQERELQVEQILRQLACAHRAAISGTPSLAPKTRSRLHDILMMQDRRHAEQALTAWLDELLQRPIDSNVAEEDMAVLQCLQEFVGDSTGAVEKHIVQRVCRCFGNKAPVDNRNLQEYLNKVIIWEHDGLTAAMTLVDAMNGAWPRSAEHFAYKGKPAKTQRDLNMLWSNPRAYAPLLLSLNRPELTGKVANLLHDANEPERYVRTRGVRHWKYPWGRDLPATVEKALVLMRDRRQGKLPAAAAVKELMAAAADAPEGMRGFTPRCVLASDPAALAWKPLSDPKASLFEMPDVSAVQLAQWDDALLGDKTDSETDFAEWEKQLDALVQNKTLPALLVFSLVEDDLSLPSNAHRPWMDVDGYDSFRSVVQFDITAEGVEILVDEKGPHFSKNDPKLRAAYRSLNLALHRCVLKMALLERDGKTEELNKAADRLAAALNKAKAWPLLWNQFSLRGVSPYAYLRLTEGFKGRRTLLTAFSEVAGYSDVAYDLGKSKEKPNAKKVAELLRDRWICDGKLPVSAEERAACVQRSIRAEKEATDRGVSGTLPWFTHLDVPTVLADTAEDVPELCGRGGGVRGLFAVEQAAAKGDLETAKRLFGYIAPNEQAYRFPAVRLAAATLARAEGRSDEAAQLERDALALTAYFTNLISSGVNEHLALYALLRHGMVQEAERLMLLAPTHTVNVHRTLAEAFAAKGMYGAAAFHLESQLHLAVRQSAPGGSGCGTHADVAKWRVAADLYRAAYLRQQGRTAEADRLEQAARKAQPKLAAAVDCSAPAAEEDCTLPQSLANSESPFESPYYTWHLPADDDGPATVVEGKIDVAHVSYVNSDRSWVRLILRSGRHLNVSFKHLSAKDLENVKDWLARNGFLTWQSKLTPSFLAKPEEMVQDKPFPGRTRLPNNVTITNGKRVIFRSATGATFSRYAETLKDGHRRHLETTMQPVRGPETKLRTFPTVAEAEADATLNGRHLLCLLLGKHDSPADKAFRAMETQSPDTVGEWNYAFSIVPCYRDAAGMWEPEARRVLDYAKPALSLLPAMGTPAWENELAAGIGLEMPVYGAEEMRTDSDRISVLTRFVAPCTEVSDTRVAEFYAAVKGKDAAKTERMLTETPALANAPLQGEYTTPLFAALYTFHAPTVEALLKHGANPNALNKNAMSVLHIYGTLPPRPEILKLLLKYGANPEGMTYDASARAFTYPICTFKNVADVELLVAAGADAHRKDGAGHTALTRQASRTDFLDFFCGRHKLDPNERALDGKNALSTDLQLFMHPEAVDKLLQYGADPYQPAVDMENRVPRDYGATNESPGYTSAELLCTANNSLHFMNLLCTAYQFRPLLDVFIKHKVDLGRKDAEGNDLLGHLIKAGKGKELAELDTLMANGADIHATFNGKPLLYHLVDCSYTAPPFSQNPQADIPAAWETAFNALVAHGLDPYAPFGNYQDIFEYAAEQKQLPGGEKIPRGSRFITPILEKWKEEQPKE